MNSANIADPSTRILTKAVTFDNMLVFSGYPETNSVHTNRELARELGLPDAIAQGLHTYGYMLEWLVDYFGEDWFKSGQMDTNFLSFVVPQDVVHVKATLGETEKVESGTRVSLAIWCENDRGVKVVAGTASAIVSD